MTLEDLHDRMLAEMPEGAEHDDKECPFCRNEQIAGDLGGQGMSKTYSEEEVQALVNAAVAKETDGLRTELDERKGSEEAQAVEAKIAEARAEAEEKVNDLQAKLDEATIKAETSSKERDEILAWLDKAKEEAAEAAERDARKDERVKQVEEVASFPEDYLKENADRWAAMEEDAFVALVADYKAVAEKAAAKVDPEGSELPNKTALKAARENDGKGGSAVREILSLRTAGVDPRELVR